MKIPKYLKLLIAIVVAELAGIIGSIFTVSSIPTWYASIARPDFAPPNWIFGPVWTTLFALMGISAFLIWSAYDRTYEEQGRKQIKVALSWFGIQLVLNTLWSIIFFGLQSPGGAFIELIFLWLAILFTIITFYKVSKPSAYLLLPYILWVSFAGYLNYVIWTLN